MEPTSSPAVDLASVAGSAVSQRSRTVGAAAEMSCSAPSRATTTLGPSRSGRQTRPTSVPASPSRGRVEPGSSASGI